MRVEIIIFKKLHSFTQKSNTAVTILLFTSVIPHNQCLVKHILCKPLAFFHPMRQTAYMGVFIIYNTHKDCMYPVP